MLQLFGRIIHSSYMKVVGIIPARYSSTRLPGKPLLDATGKPLIQYVVENVRKARRIEAVYVATDDERIKQAVEEFGCEAIMTRPDHPSGTDRLAEAAQILNLDEDDVIVNVQCDEPEIDPNHIDLLVSLLINSDAPMATLAAPIDERSANSPNNVKVVLSQSGHALYFSRAKIPFDRDGKGAQYLLHVGIYAYRKRFLDKITALEPTPLEQTEKLEQLRALENGFRIAVGVVDSASPGIDTMEDYENFIRRMQQ